MTSTITLYYNEYLNTSKNVMYSANSENDGGFATWLAANSKRTDVLNNFQYVKNGLTVSIKIPADQTLLGQKNTMWNYAAIKNSNDERTYYYYITGMTWAAKMTIRLTLGMDTIATYWADIQTNLSPATTIYREHRDRFEAPSSPVSAGSTIIRKVDEQSEGIQIANKRKISDTKFVDPKAGFSTVNKWYLIYMTQVDANNLNDNPIKCYLCADQRLGFKGSSDYTLSIDELNTNNTYYLVEPQSNTSTGHATITYNPVSPLVDPVSIELNRSVQSGYYTKVIRVFYENEKWYIQPLTYDGTTFEYKESLSAKAEINADKPELTFTNLAKGFIHLGSISSTSYTVYTELTNEDTTFGETINITSIDDIDRTDSRLNSIIELPYCPTDKILYQSQKYIKSDDWVFDYSVALLLRLKNLNADFLRTLTNYEAVDNMSYTLTANDLLPTSARNDAMESKIYHSDFNTIKWSYDGYDLTIARERLAPTSDIIPNLSIKYKQSNNLSSNLLFDVSPGVSTTYKQMADNENIIISRRNNESPIYQSSYLNYMRNGYNYDKKAIDIQRRQQIATTVVNTISSLTSLGLSVGPKIGAVVSTQLGLAQDTKTYNDILSLQGQVADLGGYWDPSSDPLTLSIKTARQDMLDSMRAAGRAETNLRNFSPIATAMIVNNIGNNINGIMSVIANRAQQENSMNAKLASLAAESASTSGSDDLNLLNYYNGNKLHKYIYDLSDQMKAPIYDLFYYLGYATNDQRKPDLYTRTNWNFIMCNPQWTPGTNRDKLPFEDYLNDISARFNAGLTVFHNNNDWEQTKNNIEVSLIN